MVDGHGRAARPRRDAPADTYHLSAYASDLAEGGPWDLVVAHSLGGSAATVAAAADPEWTARLILLDPVWHIPDDEFDALLDDQRSELELTRESLIAAKPHWDLRDVDAKIAAIGQVDPDAVVRTFTDTGRWDVTDAARALAIPTLLLGGDPEVYTMLAPSDAHAIAAFNPHIDYRIVPGSAHSPHRDVPHATRELMMGWVHDG